MNTHIKTIIFVVGAMVAIVVRKVSSFSSEIGIVTIIIVITQLLLQLIVIFCPKLPDVPDNEKL